MAWSSSQEKPRLEGKARGQLTMATARETATSKVQSAVHLFRKGNGAMLCRGGCPLGHIPSPMGDAMGGLRKAGGSGGGGKRASDPRTLAESERGISLTVPASGQQPAGQESHSARQPAMEQTIVVRCPRAAPSLHPRCNPPVSYRESAYQTGTGRLPTGGTGDNLPPERALQTATHRPKRQGARS
ncbi:hypothetical protein PMIN01_01315 [Paraphaeosphaeria minitans]|uniref:Uncharacterized protein n=1 Tax=Paraphaeosphaeria minitans TaxID=565426 RepID=A0A9P6KX41_9PLEO|nr:hypothetical protein PMIN01_01315 [Paraphaeosphaeria minitans]